MTRIPHPLRASWLLVSRSRNYAHYSARLVQARAQIARQQRFDPRSFEPTREVDHGRRQLLRQKELAATLDVVAATALDGPTSAGENPRHLVASQIRPRSPAVTEPMPHKGQAVRVDVEDAQAPRKHRAQLSRRREQRCVALALRARQNEQKRRHRRVLHH